MLLEGILFYFFKSCGLNNRWFLLLFEIKVQKELSIIFALWN